MGVVEWDPHGGYRTHLASSVVAFCVRLGLRSLECANPRLREAGPEDHGVSGDHAGRASRPRWTRHRGASCTQRLLGILIGEASHPGPKAKTTKAIGKTFGPKRSHKPSTRPPLHLFPRTCLPSHLSLVLRCPASRWLSLHNSAKRHAALPGLGRKARTGTRKKASRTTLRCTPRDCLKVRSQSGGCRTAPSTCSVCHPAHLSPRTRSCGVRCKQSKSSMSALPSKLLVNDGRNSQICLI